MKTQKLSHRKNIALSKMKVQHMRSQEQTFRVHSSHHEDKPHSFEVIMQSINLLCVTKMSCENRTKQ